MKRIGHIIIFLLSLGVMSCETVFEHPDDNAIDPTLVNLNLEIGLAISADLEFELYDVEDLSKSTEEEEDYYLRTIIEIYNDGDTSDPIIRDVIYTLYSEIDELDIHYTTQLNARRYTVAVWSDVVHSSESSDFYFFTIDNLSQVKYTEPYVGNSDLKNAFSSVADIDLTVYSTEWNAVHEYQMDLDRPQALFEIITTDLARFIESQQAENVDGELDFERYTVLVSYDGYMPYGYNVLTDKPNEARQGISYTTNIEILSNSEARLAFDHVFVNHTESGVNVSLVVYNESGNIVVEVPSLSITVNRNMKTVVTDEFLTSDYAPGIGIDPSFDGEYNIVIPD